MNYKSVLKSLDTKLGSDLRVRRYSLSEMISESYRTLYSCGRGTNLQKLVESHLSDVKSNPTDTDRLSRQLAIIKEVQRLTESAELKDEDLVPKEKYDEVTPKKERAIDLQEAKSDEQMTPDEMKAYWEKNKDSDPVLAHYKSYDEWYKVSKENGYVADEEDEDLLEDTELTDEEVDELTKHLAELRKNKKVSECTDNPVKGEGPVKESTVGKGRPLKKRSMTENRDFDWSDDLWAVIKEDGTYAGVPCRSYDEARELSYHPNSKIFKLVLEDDANESVREDKDPSPEVQERLMTQLSDILLDLGINPDDVGEIIDTFVYDIAQLVPERTNESTSWDKINLSQFREKSAGKAFVKTFKKMSTQLQEGTELSRQDSISLYKAANSAMTHLSVELEHNPEFLSTFNESVSLLSADVNDLLNSLKEGKSPSKATMQSLAKFVEALLREADEEELPPIEDEENEEVSEFDQEYAAARVDLHKDLAEENADTEDPEVAAKLAQDAEEIAALPGVTEEQLAEIIPEGEPATEETPVEEPAEEEIPEEEVTEESADPKESEEKPDLDLGDDDAELTDDELAELKRHLREMRRARNNS